MKSNPLRITALCAALALACLPASTAVAQTSSKVAGTVAAKSKQQLDKLADEYYEALARFDPVAAGANGDTRFEDQIGMSIAPKVRERHYKRFGIWLTRLHAIDRSTLDLKAQVNYDILNYELAAALRLSAFPSHLLPLNQMDSMPVTLATYASGQAGQRLVSVKDYQDYLARLNQLPAWIDQAIANMRVGIKRGVVLPRAAVTSMLPQFQKLVAASPEASIFYTPITNLPAAFAQADKQRLTAQYRRAIDKKIAPATARLAKFLETEYLPASRTSSGWSALPNGREWYLASVAAQTTTDMKPEDIHATGLREVARIQKEFAALGPKMGYSGAPAGLPQWVSSQVKYKPFKSEREVIEVYRKLDDILQAKLPSMFTLRPKTPLDVRPEPEITRATASDHYTPPAADGSRPGVFWAVVKDPRAYEVTGMTTLFLHEALPGHHFHIALLQEMGLPNFRKFGGNNAFTEGWALYAETLGREMGMFDKPESYFGHLNDELLRAARLVVDTGMHAKGWSREQAIGYLRDNLGYPDEEARAQIERYMVWPGQALGYKIGSLKILELRARAQKALGPKFSLPKFHEVVLEDGTVPLALLEKKVNRWIEKAKFQ
jgi:uncharacterized protein (DUF885 family)